MIVCGGPDSRSVARRVPPRPGSETRWRCRDLLLAGRVEAQRPGHREGRLAGRGAGPRGAGPRGVVPAALVPAALVPAALVPAALVPAALVPAALVPAALVPAVLVPRCWRRLRRWCLHRTHYRWRRGMGGSGVSASGRTTARVSASTRLVS